MPSHVVDRQVVFSGKKVRLEVHRLEDDQGTQRFREVVVHPGAAVILPILNPQQIVLIRNHRYSVGQYLIELPAGTLETNENPMNCAGRELLEETGYLAGRMEPILGFYSSPGILTEKLYAFAAYDLQKHRASPEEDEEIETLVVGWDEALEMIRGGQITDAKTVATLLFYDRFRRTH